MRFFYETKSDSFVPESLTCSGIWERTLYIQRNNNSHVSFEHRIDLSQFYSFKSSCEWYNLIGIIVERNDQSISFVENKGLWIECSNTCRASTLWNVLNRYCADTGNGCITALIYHREDTLDDITRKINENLNNKFDHLFKEVASMNIKLLYKTNSVIMKGEQERENTMLLHEDKETCKNKIKSSLLRKNDDNECSNDLNTQNVRIPNIGATCYSNTIFQLIFYLPKEVAAAIITAGTNNKLNYCNNIKEVIDQKFSNTKHNIISTANFCAKMNINSHEYGDATEFLQQVFSTCKEEMNIHGFNFQAAVLAANLKIEYEISYANKSSIVENTYSLLLPVLPNDVSLEQLLERHFNDNDKEGAEKIISRKITNAQKFLALSLIRSGKHNNQRITFNEVIDIGLYYKTPYSANYKLTAVIARIYDPKSDFAHFINIFRRNEEHWYVCNDAFIHESSYEDIKICYGGKSAHLNPITMGSLRSYLISATILIYNQE